MTLGDLLEIVGAAVGAVGVFLIVGSIASVAVGVGSALVVISLFLGYQAQVWAELPRPDEQHDTSS